MKSNQSRLILKTFLVIALMAGITACNNEKNGKADNKTENTSNAPAIELVFDKLLGTWLHEDGKNFEQWEKNGNGTYNYRAFNIKGTDTSWTEHANVYKENDRWVFENTVAGQNDGKAIKFTSSVLSDNNVQFSNPAHDFPTDINYTLADANTINAFIVGPNKSGGKDTIPYNYKRVK